MHILSSLFVIGFVGIFLFLPAYIFNSLSKKKSEIITEFQESPRHVMSMLFWAGVAWGALFLGIALILM